MSANRKSVFVTAMMVLVGAVVAFFLLGKFGKEKQPPFRRSVPGYLDQWRKADLTPISDLPDFLSSVNAVPIRSDADLSREQKDLLHAAAYKFLRAYSAGDFDTFSQFRFPITTGHADPQSQEFDLRILKESGINLPTPLDAVSVFRERWNGGFPTICTNCWISAAIADTEIVVVTGAEIPDLSNIMNLEAYHPPADTSSLSGYSPRFIFDPSPEEVIKKNGVITHALFWVVVRGPDDSQPYPVYCQWYWDPDSGSWLPWCIGDGDVRATVAHAKLF